VFLSILQRYVACELLRVFLMALSAITFILVLALLVAEAAQQGLPPGQVLNLLPLLVPGTLPFTIPTAALFAVAVVYGRLSHDNEITAIKSAGVPVTRVLWPALVLGAASSVAVFYLYEDLVPRATHTFKLAILRDIEEWLYAKLRRDLAFQTPGVNYAIFVKEVQGRRLLDATFVKKDAKGANEFVAVAREAEIHVDTKQGDVAVRMRHGTLMRNDGTQVSIEDETFHVPIPPNLGTNRLIRAREMTNTQLLEEIESLQGDPEQVISRIREKYGFTKHPGEATKESETSYILQVGDRRRWEMESEYAARPAISAGCFFFVLIGCPVAIWFHRRDYLSAFVTCFLPIIITYYPLMMFSMNLGKDGRFDPRFIMWSGNALLGGVGLALLWRLTKH
jgi:lipopolysaccharide export system permease protein